MKEKIDVTGNLEQSKVALKAEFGLTDLAQQQIDDDDRLIPNIGDSRTITQKGKFISPDGETSFATDLHFVRTRNKNRGVSVECIVPAFVMTGEKGE